MASTINISLPDSMKAYVDSQIETGPFITASQYVQELISRDRDRRRRDLEEHLLDALNDQENAIEVPEDILENGDIIAFLEEKLAESERTQ